MNRYFVMFKENVHSLKDVHVLVGVSLFCALNVVLNMFAINLTPTLRITFGSLATAASCAFYGPYPNMIAACVLDFINYMMNPTGPYQPWFMLSNVTIAVIYSLFFYRQENFGILRCAFARLLVVIIVHLFMNSLWLSMLYGNAFFVLVGERLLKNIILYPFDVALLFAAMKICSRLRVLIPGVNKVKVV